MARIHLIDGEKGGVGKSLFTRVMVQYAIDKKLEHSLVDADITNQDVKRFYNYAVDAFFSEEPTCFSTLNTGLTLVACEPDCEGVFDGGALPGTPCTIGGEPGTYNMDCECIAKYVA